MHAQPPSFAWGRLLSRTIVCAIAGISPVLCRASEIPTACPEIIVSASHFSSWNSQGNENRVRIDEANEPTSLVGRGPNSSFAGSLETSVNVLAFDLPALTGTVVHAELQLEVSFLVSFRGSEAYSWSSLTHPLVKQRVHRQMSGLIYDDPEPMEYGSGVVSEAETLVRVPLNAAFLQLAGAAAGYRLLLEGKLTSLTEDPHTAQYLHLQTASASYARLVLRMSAATAPQIITQPISRTVKAGREAQFSVAACGTAPINYQWFKNGVPMPGENHAALLLRHITAHDEAAYHVTVSNVTASTTSDAAQLGVTYEAPMMVTQPVSSSSLPAGATNHFIRGLASGAPLPSYQWRRNEANLPGETNNVLRFNPALPSQSDVYTLVASNALGSVTSSPSAVTVLPLFLYGPQDQIVLIDNPWGIWVNYWSAVEPVSLQWFRDHLPLPEATNAFLNFNATEGNTGHYFLVASNSFGAVTSVVAHVTAVEAAPQFQSWQYDRSLVAGTTDHLYVQVIGGPPPSVSWYRNGQLIPGENQATLSFDPVLPIHAGTYTVVASNRVGQATNGNFYVRVDPASIQIYSMAPTAAGGILHLESHYTGVDGASFQWRFNGQNLAGETNPFLILDQVTTNQGGFYSVIVSNQFGTITGGPFDVALTAYSPNIYVPPVQVVQTGDFAWLPAIVSGLPRPALQWKRHGEDIPGATNYGLTLSGVSTEQAGDYDVVFKNAPYPELTATIALVVNESGPLDSWISLNPKPQANPLRAVTSGNGRRVAVGDNGTVAVSLDGLNWTSRALGRQIDLRCVTFGNGLFVAGGRLRGSINELAIILTSPDGEHWVARDLSALGVVTGVAYGDGKFIAVGCRDYVAAGVSVLLTSTAGITWHEQIPHGAMRPRGISAIAFANNLWVATTDHGRAGVASTYSSSDGLSWAAGTGTDGQVFRAVTAGDGAFVAVGDNRAAYSPDGIGWTVQALPNEPDSPSLIAAAFGGGNFIVSGINGITYRSSDGATWQKLAAPVSSHDVRGAHFDGARFTLVTDAGRLLVSSNATAWIDQCQGPDTDLYSIVKGPNGYVAVGENALLFSANLIDWQEISTSRRLHHVTFGNNLYVAVGRRGLILTSVDGQTWMQRISPVEQYLEHVIWARDRFVAVGEGGVMITSTNGFDWSALPLITAADLEDVAYGNGLFVAVGGAFGPIGAYPVVLTSTNGIDWEDQPSVYFMGVRARAVAFGNHQFVMVGNDGLSATSTDGRKWFESFVANDNFRAVTHAGSRFIAVGNDGLVMSSEDGHDWQRHRISADMNFRDVMALSDCTLIVGSNGAIMKSGPTLPHLVPSLVNGHFTLSFRGGMSPRYILQSTTDFQEWTNVHSYTNAASGSAFAEPAAVTLDARFYRVIPSP